VPAADKTDANPAIRSGRWRSDRIRNPVIRELTAPKLFEDAASALGYHPFPTPVSSTTAVHAGRSGIPDRRHTAHRNGCSLLRLLFQPWLPDRRQGRHARGRAGAGLRTGRCTTWPNSHAIRVELKNGVASGA